MKMGITVHFYDGFDAAREMHQDALREALLETAFEAEAIAKGESAVDTGAQRASVHVVTATKSSYAKAAQDASTRRPGVTLFPEFQPSSPDQVILAVGVNYGFWNEILGKPFLGPAVDQVAPTLGQRCRAIVAESHQRYLASIGGSSTTGNIVSAQARRFGRGGS